MKWDPPTHTFILLPFLPNDYNWTIPGLSLQRVFQKNIQREAGSQSTTAYSWLHSGMALISKPSSQEPLTRSLLHYSEKKSCLSFPTWKVEIIWQLSENCKNIMKIYRKFLARYTLCKKKISASSCTRPCNNREMLFVSQSYENSMKTYESVKFSIWYIWGLMGWAWEIYYYY